MKDSKKMSKEIWKFNVVELAHTIGVLLVHLRQLAIKVDCYAKIKITIILEN